MTNYHAHSKPDQSPLPENNKDDWHLLKTHLSVVGEEAAKKSAFWGREGESKLAGLLHDLGKYSDNLQKRLDGQMSGVNHWSQGAIIAWQNRTRLAALAIYGHHVGIPSYSDLKKLAKIPADEKNQRVCEARQSLLRDCLDKAILEERLFTLTVHCYPWPSL